MKLAVVKSRVRLSVSPLFSWPQLVRGVVLPCLLGAFSTLASAEGNGREPLQICIADFEVPPFTAPDREGLAQQALRQAAHLQGREVTFVARPWRRCFVETAEGTFHGMLPVAYSDGARQLLSFPEVGGRADARLQLDSIRVLVMRSRGSLADWDGQRFSGVQGPILYLSGLKALDDYFAHSGLLIDSSARDVDALGRMLLRKRSNVAVDLEARVRGLMQQEQFRSSIEVLPKPLFELPVYLAISPALQTAQPDFVAQLWRDTARAYRSKLTEAKAAQAH